MATLSSYITETRRLLHDANGNFYSDPELTDYINSARKRVVRDTGCLRTIQITQTPLAPVATATQPSVDCKYAGHARAISLFQHLHL